MHNIIGLHMIPNPDTGLVHEPTADCKCGPSKDSSVNPKVPIYKHKTVGVCSMVYNLAAFMCTCRRSKSRLQRVKLD